MDYFVYIWNSPDGIPYYVGEGRGDRWFKPHSIPRPKAKELIQVFSCESKSECVAYEAQLIQFFGRLCDGGTLLNKASGPGHIGCKHSLETRRKISNVLSNLGAAYIVSPEGEIFLVESQAIFAEEHNLQKTLLHHVLQGNRKHHRGWHLPGTTIEPKRYTHQPVELISPDGECYVIDNLVEHADKFNLSYKCLNAVINGANRHHRGWHLKGTDGEPRQRDYSLNPVALEAPNGDIHLVTNIAKHASEYGLNRGNLYSVVCGLRKSHKGWRLVEA